MTRHGVVGFLPSSLFVVERLVVFPSDSLYRSSIVTVATMMKIFLFVLLAVTHCQAELWFQQKEKQMGRPRRRLTDVPDEVPPPPAGEEVVEAAVESTDMTCGNELSQIVDERDKALETVQQLSVTVEELKAVQERTMEDLKNAHDSRESALKGLEKSKDDVIARLEQQLAASEGSAKELEAKASKLAQEKTQMKEIQMAMAKVRKHPSIKNGGTTMNGHTFVRLTYVTFMHAGTRALRGHHGGSWIL
jgi:hypothetical protein